MKTWERSIFLYLIIPFFVFQTLPTIVEGQIGLLKPKSVDQENFEIQIDKNESDSTTILEVTITNKSTKEYYISIGETGFIQQENDREIFFHTTYSHISDPLLMPKLEMPFYLLKQDSFITLKKEFRSIHKTEVEVYFDFFERNLYPYKRLIKTKRKRRRMRNKRTYSYIMDFSGDVENLDSIFLLDYYNTREEEGKIKDYYEKITLE